MSIHGMTRSVQVAGFIALVAGVSLWLGLGRDSARADARDAQTDAPAVQADKVPVLIELFTSEGCSSCPPADELLAQLDHQPVPSEMLIVLSEHVDYWNHDGWRDRFSSLEMTERQKDYGDFFKLNDVFTPQMVVNGTTQMNGTDVKSLQAALQQAGASHPLPIKITSVAVTGNHVTFTLKGGVPDSAGAVNVYAALVDPQDTTEVRAGENRGHTLQHVGVVRKLVRIGNTWRTQDLGTKPLELNGDVSGKPGLDGMRLVVFVQTKHIGPVQGADVCLITSAKTDGGPIAPCPAAAS